MTAVFSSLVKNLRRKSVASLTLLFTLLSAASSSAAESNYFAGKTIRVVVGSSAGGGYDLWARLMAQHIGKHIPGNPSVVVQNMPGAGGAVAANYIYGVAKPDALALGAFDCSARRARAPSSRRPRARVAWPAGPCRRAPGRPSSSRCIRKNRRIRSTCASTARLRPAPEPRRRWVLRSRPSA